VLAICHRTRISFSFYFLSHNRPTSCTTQTYTPSPSSDHANFNRHVILAGFAASTSARTYECSESAPVLSLTPSGSVSWSRLACQKDPSKEDVEPLLINALTIDLTAKGIKIRPGVSSDDPLKGVDEIAANMDASGKSKVIAGINGGYFWRTDITPFWLCKFVSLGCCE
jgi:hypothetical protein